MKYGLARIASSAAADAGSRSRPSPPSFLVERHQAIDLAGASAGGDTPRRRVRLTICRAHGRSSRRSVGRQLKIFCAARRLEMPVSLVRPLMTRSRRCGSVVMPAPPEPPPANDQSCGRIRSSYGPSSCATNAAATLCWPALDEDRLGAHRRRAAAVGAACRSGLVLEQRDALAVDRDVDVFEARVRRRTSTIDFEDVLAVGREHVVDDHAAARAVRRAVDVIPRVLRDVARRWCRSRRSPARCRSPTAMRLMSLAAFRYASSSVGDSACSSAMLSKFALFVSSGSQLPASTSRSEQVVDRARVLGAVQPLERAAAGIRASPRRAASTVVSSVAMSAA